MGSAVLLSILGCTPTRPVSGAPPEVAKAQNSSAASASASPVVPAPPAQSKQTEPEQKSAAATKPPAAKTNTSTTVKAAMPKSTAQTASANAKPAAKATTPAPAAPVAKPTSVASTPEKKQATLDLKALEQNLRDTPAIGVFTKLSLKNQVDDLLSDFRDFYRGKIKVQLSELRQRYDLLLMKVLSLLQDSDAKLASAIVSSREAIWDILKDPNKFAQI